MRWKLRTRRARRLDASLELRRCAAFGFVLPALFLAEPGAKDTAAPPPASPVSLLTDADALAPLPELVSFEPAVAPPWSDLAVEAAPAAPVDFFAGEIRPGQSLARALSDTGVDRPAVNFVTRELASMFDVRRARPGDRWMLRLATDGSVAEFSYASVRKELYRLERRDGKLVAERRGGDMVRRSARIAGVVSTTLYAAVDDLGEKPELARDFAKLFAYDVDFARGQRPGDEFQILYERLYRTDADGGERYERPGRILAARYVGRSGEHSLVYFQHDEKHGEYYRPDGSPLKKSFLIAPLEYSKVTSGFSTARVHPILGVTRPHLGIDYAAPHGTPLWAVADGQVIWAGRLGGFGNLVKIQHPNGYVSWYSHLSRFAKGLKVGDTVRQKQVIGHVGSTGLATGPHVCFRVSKNGAYVNPASLGQARLTTASVSKRSDFRATRDTLLAGLRSSEFVAVDEAL
jgi:murein DD-endopeptidase MepM/ murein hydrolase activator NlpD